MGETVSRLKSRSLTQITKREAAKQIGGSNSCAAASGMWERMWGRIAPREAMPVIARQIPEMNGSPSRIRTYGQVINSHLLYR